MSEKTRELTFEDLNIHEQEAVEYSGCSLEDAYKVVNIMRDDVFHSTLDWQSEAELRRGARKAYKLLQENRADYEAWFDQVRRVTLEGLAREEGKAP